MKKIIVGIALAVVVGISFWYSLGGESGKGNLFGQAPGASVLPISEIRSHPERYVDQVVTVEGEMTQECQETGCWWYIKDKGGEIRADSSSGGFALPLRQQGKTIRTSGKIIRQEGGDLEIAALGAAIQ